MGISPIGRTGLADALFDRVQQRVLALLFSDPTRSFHTAELIRAAGSGTGAVHRQLTRLAQSGLVTVARVGNQKHYRANRESPIFNELHGLVLKTVGLAVPLEDALVRFAKKISAAFVYGSVPTGRDTARSDIDLMVLANGLDYPELIEALQRAELRLNRTVNPHLMTVREWKRKRRVGNAFVMKVHARPKIFVIGSDADIA
jgi:predicted nucleotidyltransferase